MRPDRGSRIAEATRGDGMNFLCAGRVLPSSMAERVQDFEKLASHSSEEESSNKEDIDPPSTSDPSYSRTGPCPVSTKQCIGDCTPTRDQVKVRSSGQARYRGKLKNGQSLSRRSMGVVNVW